MSKLKGYEVVKSVLTGTNLNQFRYVDLELIKLFNFTSEEFRERVKGYKSDEELAEKIAHYLYNYNYFVRIILDEVVTGKMYDWDTSAVARMVYNKNSLVGHISKNRFYKYALKTKSLLEPILRKWIFLIDIKFELEVKISPKVIQYINRPNTRIFGTTSTRYIKHFDEKVLKTLTDDIDLFTFFLFYYLGKYSKFTKEILLPAIKGLMQQERVNTFSVYRSNTTYKKQLINRIADKHKRHHTMLRFMFNFIQYRVLNNYFPQNINKDRLTKIILLILQDVKKPLNQLELYRTISFIIVLDRPLADRIIKELEVTRVILKKGDDLYLL